MGVPIVTAVASRKKKKRNTNKKEQELSFGTSLSNSNGFAVVSYNKRECLRIGALLLFLCFK